MERQSFFPQPDLSGVHFGPVNNGERSPLADPNFNPSLLRIDAQPVNTDYLKDVVSVVAEKLPLKLTLSNTNVRRAAGVLSAVAITQVAAQSGGDNFLDQFQTAIMAANVVLPVVDTFWTARVRGSMSEGLQQGVATLAILSCANLAAHADTMSDAWQVGAGSLGLVGYAFQKWASH